MTETQEILGAELAQRPDAEVVDAIVQAMTNAPFDCPIEECELRIAILYDDPVRWQNICMGAAIWLKQAKLLPQEPSLEMGLEVLNTKRLQGGESWKKAMEEFEQPWVILAMAMSRSTRLHACYAGLKAAFCEDRGMYDQAVSSYLDAAQLALSGSTRARYLVYMSIRAALLDAIQNNKQSSKIEALESSWRNEWARVRDGLVPALDNRAKNLCLAELIWHDAEMEILLGNRATDQMTGVRLDRVPEPLASLARTFPARFAIMDALEEDDAVDLPLLRRRGARCELAFVLAGRTGYLAALAMLAKERISIPAEVSREIILEQAAAAQGEYPNPASAVARHLLNEMQEAQE